MSRSDDSRWCYWESINQEDGPCWYDTFSCVPEHSRYANDHTFWACSAHQDFLDAIGNGDGVYIPRSVGDDDKTTLFMAIHKLREAIKAIQPDATVLKETESYDSERVKHAD